MLNCISTVGVAQLVERRTVAPNVEGSNPFSHPNSFPAIPEDAFLLHEDNVAPARVYRLAVSFALRGLPVIDFNFAACISLSHHDHGIPRAQAVDGVVP